MKITKNIFRGRKKQRKQVPPPNEKQYVLDGLPSKDVIFKSSNWAADVFTSDEFTLDISSDFFKEDEQAAKKRDRGDSLEKMLQQGYQRSPQIVAFEEDVMVKRVPPTYKVGGDIDRRDLWYQDDEYKDIVWKAKKVVKRARCLAEDNEPSNKQYCLRGLEHVAKSSRARNPMVDGRGAVLDEQNYQFFQCEDEYAFPLDENRIAAVYESYNRIYRREALERALWDAREVELYAQSPEETETSTSPPPPPPSSSRSPMPSSKPRLALSSSFSPITPHKKGMMFTCIDKTIQKPPTISL